MRHNGPSGICTLENRVCGQVPLKVVIVLQARGKKTLPQGGGSDAGAAPVAPNGVLFLLPNGALCDLIKHGVDFVNCFRPVRRPNLLEDIANVNFHSVWSKPEGIGNRLVCLSLPQDFDDLTFPSCEHFQTLGLMVVGSEDALNIMQVLGRDENTSCQRHRYCFDANRYSGIAWKVAMGTLLENAQDLLKSA